MNSSLLNNKIIMHIDMDAFFVSVERMLAPNLNSLPVVTSNSHTRGVVTCASYEARKFGISAGMSIKKALDLAPNIKVIVSNHKNYAEVSQRIFQIIKSFVDVVEQSSIDEWYLDITYKVQNIECKTFDTIDIYYTNGCNLSNQIKNKISQEFGNAITCSIGIGPNKLIAKIASGLHKPDGLVAIKPVEVGKFMDKLSISELPGVGPKTLVVLKRLGINTCNDLQKTKNHILNYHFGKYGLRLKEFAYGRGSDEVVPNDLQEIQSSIGNSETFDKDIYKLNEFKHKLYNIAYKVGTRLREMSLSARVLHLIIRFKNFVTETKQITCNYSFNDIDTIYKLALRLSDGVNFKRGIRLIGIRLTGLTDFRQQKLFTEKINSPEFINTIDYINKKWGKTLIKPLDV